VPEDQTSTRIVTENVREEAKKWTELATQMQGVSSNPVNNDGLELNLTSFFIGPTEMVATGIHYAAYVGYYDHVKKLVTEAAAEWEQLRGALDRMADEFDATDQTAQADLEKVYTAPATTSDGKVADN
jgi:hypothetical protein